MSKYNSKKLRTIALIILGFLFFWNIPILLSLAPSLETTSPDGQFKCRIKFTFIPSTLYDSELQVTNINSGETVTAKKIEGGFFGEKPVILIWDESSKYFTYVFDAEVTSKARMRFDVNASPFEVTFNPSDSR